jgi:hypothetical protein
MTNLDASVESGHLIQTAWRGEEKLNVVTLKYKTKNRGGKGFVNI